MPDRDKRIAEICQQAVARLSAALGEVEIGIMLLDAGTLRHVAHSGTLPLIYEIPREQGGVSWRTVDARELQVVSDVRSDPDYLASDERIRAELTAPVLVGDEVVAVIDVEFREPFDERAVESLGRTATELADELAPYLS